MKKIQIVKIIDDQHLVINAGSKSEIKQGDKLKILDKNAEEVRDPERNEIIGYINGVKDFVIAKEVQEKMTICESLSYDVDIFSLTNPFKLTEQKRLNIDFTEVTGGEYSTNAIIKIGDEVEKI